MENGENMEDKICGCGNPLEKWENAGTYYCEVCDNEQKHWPDGTIDVVS